jgi:LPXTG-motif cell wall-anchored protein
MDRDGYAGPECTPDGYGGWDCPAPAAGTTAPATLPVTGHETAVMAGSGVLALAAGAALIALSRRRRD